MGELIRASNLWGYSDLVRELGGDPSEFLARFRIPVDIEHQLDAFIEFRSGARLIETTAHELRSPDFGLQLSRSQGLQALGPVSVVVRNARTVRDALTAAAKYLQVHSPAIRLHALDDHSSDQDLTFNFEVTERLADLNQVHELSMANFSRIVGLLAGSDAHLAAVSFPHKQVGPDAAYIGAFGCPVLFRQAECQFQVARHIADRVIDAADGETLRIASRYLEAEFVPGDATVTEQVAVLVRKLLPVERAAAEAVAEQLAIHPRTLQRRLAEEGASIHEIIDAERRKLAVRYLAERRLSLSQVAGMLGYSEQSSLNRACRRWFATTPREYRAEQSTRLLGAALG